MLGPVSQTRLSSFLEQLAEGEKKSQAARQQLAAHHLFQPLTAFHRIDRAQKGSIVPQDLQEFLIQNGIHPTEAQLYVMFKAADSSRIGQLSKQQFSKAILPKTHDYLMETALVRVSSLVPFEERLPTQVQFQLARVLEQMILNHRIAEVSRADLHSSSDYSPLATLQSLDLDKDGIIRQKDLDAFLRKNGRFLSKETLQHMVRMIDEDRDGLIRSNELYEVLNPFDTFPYQGYRVAKQSESLNQNLKRSRQAEEMIDREKELNAVIRQQAARKEAIQQDIIRSRLAEQNLRKSREQLIYQNELARSHGISEGLRRSRQKQQLEAQKLRQEREQLLALKAQRQREQAQNSLKRSRELEIQSLKKERDRALAEQRALITEREIARERVKAEQRRLITQREMARERVLAEQAALRERRLITQREMARERVLAEQAALRESKFIAQRELAQRERARVNAQLLQRQKEERELQWQRQRNADETRLAVLNRQAAMDRVKADLALSKFQSDRHYSTLVLENEQKRSRIERQMTRSALQREIQKTRLQSEARRERLIEGLRKF